MYAIRSYYAQAGLDEALAGVAADLTLDFESAPSLPDTVLHRDLPAHSLALRLRPGDLLGIETERSFVFMKNEQ